MMKEIFDKIIEDCFQSLRKKINFSESNNFNFNSQFKIPVIKNEFEGVRWGIFTLEDKEKLENEGLEIDLENDLGIFEDFETGIKTLTIRGKERVILYIRDVNSYGREFSDPKFHVSWCSILNSKYERKEFGHRYVVSQRLDGIFKINRIAGNKLEKEDFVKLNICQNCLHDLSWENYNKIKMKEDSKKEIVEGFSISNFFEKYPKDLYRQNPDYNSENAPLNVYPPDFKKISDDFRVFKRWICDDCNENFSHKKSFLHTHHINGDKTNNNYSNFEALCYDCHSKRHSHMKKISKI